MDYKEKYEQALERARQFSEKPYLEDSAGIVEYIFPELAESENEKIRKALLNEFIHLQSKGYKFAGLEGEEIIAWLEKQGEQTVELNFKDLDDIKRACGIFNKNDIGEISGNTIDWIAESFYKLGLEKQGEQKSKKKELKKIEPKPHRMISAEAKEALYDKPAWSEEDEDAIGMAIIALEDMYDPEAPNNTYAGYTIPFNRAALRLRYLKDRVQLQPKQEWSEEDEEIHRKCICAMRASACGFPEEEKFVEQVDNWLKSLKDRVQPQPRQEWCEEDESHIRYLIECLENCKKGVALTMTTSTAQEYINWLKSLKDRVQPQPRQE